MKTKVLLIGIGTGLWLKLMPGLLGQGLIPNAPPAPAQSVPAVPGQPFAQPAPLPAPPALAPTRQPTLPTQQLRYGMLQEEREGNLESAMSHYREIIREFDQYREEAAQAIFRLAEVYRKLGRVEEAKILYARILREFPDKTQLAQFSLQHLSQRSTAPRSTESRSFPGGPGAGIAAPDAPPQIKAELEQEFARQLQESVPVRQYGYKIRDLRIASDGRKVLVVFSHPERRPDRPDWEFVLRADDFGRYRGVSIQPFLTSAGITPPVWLTLHSIPPDPPALLPTQESLDRQLELIDQEIQLIEQQLAFTESMVKNGREPHSAVIPLKREILKLKRQKAQLESGSFAKKTDADENPFGPPAADPTGRTETHVVHPGENLYSIARAYGAHAEDLVRANPGIDFQKLGVGESLKIPIQIRHEHDAPPEMLRETAQKNACIANLRQIDGAKEQWALENRKPDGAPAPRAAINQFISKGAPVCPAGGTYDYGIIGKPPRCSLEDQGHRLEN